LQYLKFNAEILDFYVFIPFDPVIIHVVFQCFVKCQIALCFEVKRIVDQLGVGIRSQDEMFVKYVSNQRNSARQRNENVFRQKSRRTFSGLAKVAIFTTNVSAEHGTATFAKPVLCVRPSFSVVVCLSSVVSLCVGLVALLQFFGWLCASGKTANVLPNALDIVIGRCI
jgi:hypothetical protein